MRGQSVRVDTGKRERGFDVQTHSPRANSRQPGGCCGRSSPVSIGVEYGEVGEWQPGGGGRQPTELY